MLIKDLPFIESCRKNTLGKYYEMNADEFVSEISSLMNRGVYINKKLKQIYDELLRRLPSEETNIEEEPIKEVDPILLELENIPTEFLQHYIEPSEYKGNINKISAETKNLRMLLENPIKGNSKLKFVETAKKWCKLVESNKSSLIADWKDLNTTKSLPTNIDSSVSFTENLQKAIIEFAQIIKSRKSDSRYNVGQKDLFLCDVLLLAYRDGKNNKEIAKLVTDKKDYTPERIRQIKNSFFEDFLIGEVIYQNLKLSDVLVETCQSLQEECIFHPVDKLEHFSGSRDTTFANILGFDIAEFRGFEFVVPSGTTMIYKTVGSATIDTLIDILLPEDVDTIFDKICEHQKIESLNFDPDFVRNILYYDKLTDIQDDGTIMIKDEHLPRALNRMYRIIYYSPTRLNTDEVKKRYRERFGIIPAESPSQNNKYNINQDSNKEWYYGAPLRPINHAISDFAEERIVFYLSELEDALKVEGYPIPNPIPRTIRTRITNLCSVDNNDSNHFCHKDFVSDYPSYNWRNSSKYGHSNWIANEVKKLIDTQDGIAFDVVLEEILKNAAGTDYEDVTRKRGKYIIRDFCGDDKPFIIKENYLSKNTEVFKKTDFSVIGLRKGTNIYFNQIRSIAFNEVKRAEDGKLPLTDLVRIVNEIIDDNIRKNVVERAIEDKEKRFKKIDIELQVIDGNRYVVWTGQHIVEEPTYEIVATENETDEKQVREIVPTEVRPGIRYRQDVDWAALKNVLKNELSFYQGWMMRENYDLDSSIEKFLKILASSRNSNLSKKLPQNLYEYWFAQNDKYDRHTYLTNLTLFFEAFLAEVYYQQKGIRLIKKGLSDWAEEFAGLPQKLLYNRESKGFDRIASDLHYKRNRIAHGDEIELSSRETAIAIADYVALYIYITAKYYKKEV